MLIEVTAEDIAMGQRCCSTGCPVALAMRRTTGEEWSVTAMSMTRISSSPKRVKFSNRIRHLIRGFDDGIVIEPFTIRLEGDLAYRSDC